MLKSALIVLILLTPMQSKKSASKTSESVVKVTAKAEPPAADGTQKVTLAVKIDNDYHIYANPVGNPDLDSAKTVLSFTGTDDAKIEYPKGKSVPDKVVGDYIVYEKEITITAKIKRKSGAAVEANLKCQACNEKSCLPIATIKTKVEMP